MYKHGLNDDGVAYAWMAIIIFLILGAAIWLVAIVGVQSELIPKINDDIAEGKVTVQQRGAIQFNQDMAMAIPIWMILGVFVFAIATAIRRKA